MCGISEGIAKALENFILAESPGKARSPDQFFTSLEMKEETRGQYLLRLKQECFSEKLITYGESAQVFGKTFKTTLHETTQKTLNLPTNKLR